MDLIEISRNASIATIQTAYDTLTREEKEFAPLERNDIPMARRNKMINSLVNSGKYKLRFGERLSYNYNEVRPAGLKGRPRTTDSGRQRVCRPVYKENEKGKLVEDQSKDCLKIGRRQGMVGSQASIIRNITNRTKVETLRRLAQRNRVRGFLGKNKNQLIEALRDKNVLNYTLKDLE